MKLTVLGGCGVRSPFLIKTLVTNAKSLSITEICLMDIDAQKIEIFGKLSIDVAARIDPNVKVVLSNAPREALQGANYIISTLRVGGDQSRLFDEELAQKHGLLGQETTGIGGFAMALRSIPVLCQYMEIAQEVAAKDVILFNFTNPSGIVTQALLNSGFKNVYGICDGPTSFHRQLAQMCDVSMSEFDVTCYGLNHLSFYREFKIKGVPSTEQVLSNQKLFRNTEMKIFDENSVSLFSGELPNEYVYFFLYNDRVIASIEKNGGARGALIADINRRMIEELSTMGAQDAEIRFAAYIKYLVERENSYFAIESEGKRENKKEELSLQQFIDADDEGGYSGIALNIISGLIHGTANSMTVLVRNQGNIPFLDDKDVIEITCDFVDGAVKPRSIDQIPAVQQALIHTVKVYERLSVEAILEKDSAKALRALTIHPLINSSDRAKSLLKCLLEEHREYTGEWK